MTAKIVMNCVPSTVAFFQASVRLLIFPSPTMSFASAARQAAWTILPWVPIGLFFVEHGYSLGTVHGRSMQASTMSTHALTKLGALFTRARPSWMLRPQSFIQTH